MITTKIRNSVHQYYKSALVGFALLVTLCLSLGMSSAAMAAPIIPGNFAANPTSLDPDPNDLGCPTTRALSTTQTGQGAPCILRHIVAPIVGALVALTGVLVVISIIVAGIQYSSSAGDPSKLAAARKRIFNAVIALLSFTFLYAFVNWIIPGGIANGGNVGMIESPHHQTQVVVTNLERM